MTSNVRPSPRVRAQRRIWQAGAIEATCPHVSLQPRLPAAPTALPPLFTAWAASPGSWEGGVGSRGRAPGPAAQGGQCQSPSLPAPRMPAAFPHAEVPHPPVPIPVILPILGGYTGILTVSTHYGPATGLSVFTAFYFISTIILRIRSLANDTHGRDAIPAHRGAVSPGSD